MVVPRASPCDEAFGLSPGDGAFGAVTSESALNEVGLRGMEVEAAAATRMQAAFRGYNVRRRKPLIHLREIDSVRRKLNELQAKAADPVYMERVCVEVMECRKLTEGVMALVLQLDALQGVHPVVRDIRRSVNREVVQFMEVIDAVVVGADSSPWQDSRNAPNIVRSNSVSHFDRVSNHSLTRMYSLDDCFYPEDTEMRFKPQEGFDASGAHTSSLSTKADFSLDHLPSQDPESKLGRNSPNEGEKSHLEEKLVGLDRTLAAALVIQSRFRGYNVRRSRPLNHLRNIADVKLKFTMLSDWVSSPGFPSKLRDDKMERLKVTESITALLLQLDSVQGVDQVIRDIRKSVTKDVFKLQELVDALINKAENVEGSSPSSAESSETASDQRNVEDFGGETPSPMLICLRQKSEPCVNDIETLDSQDSDGLAVGDISVNEEVHGQPLEDCSSPSCEIEDKLGMARSDQERDGAATDPNTKCNISSGELDDVQVRAVDIPMQNRATSCSSSESAEENRLHDKQYGSCAAILSGKSCGLYDELSGSVTTLDSDSAAVEEVWSKQVHCEDTMASQMRDKGWHDSFVDAWEVYETSEGASLEDLQALALPGIRRAPITNSSISFVKHMYDAQHMETFRDDYYSSCLKRKLEAENDLPIISKTSEENMYANGPNQVIILRDEYVSVGAVELDTPAKLTPGSDIASTLGGESVLQSETIMEDIRCFGMECVDEGPETTRVYEELYFYGGKVPAAIADGLRNQDKLPNLFLPRFEYATEAFKASPLWMNKEVVCDSLAWDLSSETLEPSGCRDSVCTRSTTTVENKQHPDIAKMDLVSETAELITENTKLKTLLNEVLIYAEMQSAKSSIMQARLEKQEAEIVQHKKREEIWKKKSKSARRRR